METLTGKVVSNIDQRLRDHEFQNKKEVVLSLDASLRAQSSSRQHPEPLYEELGHPGWESWGSHTLQRG